MWTFSLALLHHFQNCFLTFYPILGSSHDVCSCFVIDVIVICKAFNCVWSYCTVYLCGMLEAIQRPFAVYFNKQSELNWPPVQFSLSALRTLLDVAQSKFTSVRYDTRCSFNTTQVSLIYRTEFHDTISVHRNVSYVTQSSWHRSITSQWTAVG